MRIPTVARILTLIGILLLIIVSLRAYQSAVNFIEMNREIGIAHKTIDALSHITITLTDAETGQRGYLLTGDEAYLPPCEQAMASIDSQTSSLKARLSDDISVQELFPRLEENIHAKLTEIEKTIRLRKSDGLAAALAIVETNAGQQYMREVRSIVDEIRTSRKDILDRHLNDIKSTGNYTLTLILAGLGLAGLLLVAASLLASVELWFSKNQVTALAQSYDLVRNVLSANPTVNVIVGPDGGIVESNLDVVKIRSLLSDSKGQPSNYADFIEALGPFDAGASNTIRTGIQQVLHNKTDVFSTEASSGQGESRRHMIIHTKAMEIARQRHVLLCISDNTKSENALELARFNEEMFRLAMKNAPIGMALVSPEGSWVRVNNAICEIVGYTNDELLATDFQTITHPDDLDKDLDLLHKMLRKEIDEYHIEKRYIRKSGRFVWIELSVSLVWDSEDKPLYFISQIQDIDARKRAEVALKESKERLELALRGGELGTWDWNIVEERAHFDHRWANMLGYDLGEIAQDSSTWKSSIHPDDWTMVSEALDSHLRGETQTYEVEHRLRHKKGSWVWVLTKGTVIERDDSGRPVRICGTHLDITTQKDAQDALTRFSKDLERSNRELEDFAHIASHDLKEPLRGIKNYASFLLEDYEDKLDEDGNEKLHTLVRLANRLSQFIEALFQYSRVGQSEFTVKNMDLRLEVEETVESFEVWLEEENGTVIVSDSLPMFSCHPVLASEVFRNLITNGIKYNDKDTKTVEVGATVNADGETEFYVRDNGIGIPEKHQATIFRIFKRLHGRDKFGGGTGAGLSIAQKIVHRHGGRIWLESTEDEGTTFYFTLAEPPSPEL